MEKDENVRGQLDHNGWAVSSLRAIITPAWHLIGNSSVRLPTLALPGTVVNGPIACGKYIYAPRAEAHNLKAETVWETNIEAGVFVPRFARVFGAAGDKATLAKPRKHIDPLWLRRLGLSTRT